VLTLVLITSGRDLQPLIETITPRMNARPAGTSFNREPGIARPIGGSQIGGYDQGARPV